ncbi:MAG: peptidylprolyl isomerase [Betaproteobacteria bacterium]|nr:peptidylprolyl isomerase [Betaproteobacteria bacterium]
MIAVARNTVVTLAVDLSDALGEPLQAAGQRVTYLHGGYGGLLDAVENALEGRVAGDAVQLHLEPENAFGDYAAELLRIEPRSRYGEGLEAGMLIEDDFDGEGTQVYTVTGLADGKVVLDGNHPLAGVALRIACTVIAVRPASAEEIRLGEPVLD